MAHSVCFFLLNIKIWEEKRKYLVDKADIKQLLEVKLYKLKLFSSRSALFTCIILLLLFSSNCFYTYTSGHKLTSDSRYDTIGDAKILYLYVRFDGETYHINRAKIFDSTFTYIPYVKILGQYGVKCMSPEGKKLFELHHYFKPVQKVRLLISYKVSYVEFVQEIWGEEIINARFSREEILSVATYPDRE